MTYFHAVYPALSSALRRFTVLFGMGRRGTNALWSSEKLGGGRCVWRAPSGISLVSLTLEEVLDLGVCVSVYCFDCIDPKLRAYNRFQVLLAVIGSSHTGN